VDALTSLTLGNLYLALVAVAAIVATSTSLLAHLRGREIQELYRYVTRWSSLDDDLAGVSFMDGTPSGGRHDPGMVSDPRAKARHRAALR
jgi:hypothetical protein